QSKMYSRTDFGAFGGLWACVPARSGPRITADAIPMRQKKSFGFVVICPLTFRGNRLIVAGANVGADSSSPPLRWLVLCSLGGQINDSIETTNRDRCPLGDRYHWRCSGANDVRSGVPAKLSRSVSCCRDEARSQSCTARHRLPADRECHQCGTGNRCVEDRHRPREDAAPLSGSSERPGWLLRPD